MTSEIISNLTDNSLPTNPKCLWTPSNPHDTQMEKFRVLMQTKYQDLKLGMKYMPFFFLAFDKFNSVY